MPTREQISPAEAQQGQAHESRTRFGFVRFLA